MDRLTSMRVFVGVVDLGTFKLAAEQAGVSPTMAAKHITALEQHLGGALLVKTTRSQGLTRLGEAYFERCKKIIQDVDQADRLSESILQQPRGMLRITAPPTLGSRILPPVIAKFLNEFKDISIDLRLGERKVDFTLEPFDIGIRIGDIVDESLVARSLKPQEIKLAASPAYLRSAGKPTVPSDLAGHDLIGFRQWSRDKTWIFRRDGEEHVVAVRPRLIVDSSHPAHAAAVAGFGIVQHSALALADDLASGRLVEVLPDFAIPSEPVHLVYHPARLRPARASAFIRFALAELS